MKSKKIVIEIKGIVTKVNGEEFTEQEYEQLVDAFIELVESKDLMFGGGFGHLTEKEYMSN